MSSAAAEDNPLLKALVTSSPEIAAAEAQAEAAKAELWAARGARLPQLRLEGQAGTLEETFRVNGVPGELTATRDPAAASAVLEQALFTSGRIGGSIGAAKAQASEAENRADATRQDIILRGATVMADLVRDREILRARKVNEEVLAERLRESRARLEAGLATVTDLRQSEARLSLAEAERLAAQAAVDQSAAAFIRVFGVAPPEDLQFPQVPNGLPETLDDALSRALSLNPDLEAAKDGQSAARQAIRAERAQLLPQVSLNASASYLENQRFGIELGEAEQLAVTVQGRWNVFSGGSGYARTRAAKRRASAAKSLTLATERQIREQTVRAWSNVVAGRSVAAARSAQAEAAATAADGVAAEFRNGRRTRLDVLDADRERTEAEVGLLAARRDLLVAEFALLRVTGQL
ncbi:TolC family outer membrane protein [Parvularcula lutaonensis]|uniref:TolC family outer membrane protein n=1 Tax=Parvularcula lutaonensis TaxID=491923 RepID=A0ABV7MBS1_9PROT|nr:TolC family outer membrane protein [Parvularcula lutaonensis]